MYLYQMNMPSFLLFDTENTDFTWHLGNHCMSNAKVKGFENLVFQGYVFDNVIFDFEEGIIRIYQSRRNTQAIRTLLNSFCICNDSTLSFSIAQNKNSYPL